MRATGINHVSISAPDLEASIRFYTQVFGMERVPAPKFPEQKVAWLRLGEQQLHLFQREGARPGGPEYHHFALDVDDFEAAYRKVHELEITDDVTFLTGLRELPGGEAQMYLRDPGGNLVEVNWPDASSLDRGVVAEIVRLADVVPQDAEGYSARLYATSETEPRRNG
ncbi:MAG: VOC family protein [Solirubrobacterales bacterium]|nr:VOC family protein [Solirubrobacterales bacterium]